MKQACSHPAQLTGRDGVRRCLTCGEVVRPPKEKKPKAPPDESGNKQTDKQTDE